MNLVTLRKPSLWRGLALLLTLAFLAIPLAAVAGAKESKERAAKTACLAGDYAKGVALLAELYVSSSNDVTYLFNQGRCFEQNGKYEEAIVRFREYQLKNADAGNAPDETAEKHIANCQALLDQQKPSHAAAVVVAPPPASAPSPAAEPSDRRAPTVEAKPEARVERAEAPALGVPGRGTRIAGIAAAAVGVAGIAAGVILNIKANQIAKDLEAANGSSTVLYSRSSESSRATYQTLGWVAYGAGAACLAGGVVLYLLGQSQGQNVQVAFVPVVGAGNAGASLQGAF